MIASALACCALLCALPQWPAVTAEMKPWVYNWWMGSAVDEAGLEFQCRSLAEQGFGGFHVIPIYGAKGFEPKFREFLSSSWIDGWNLAARTARRYGLGIDLTMGSGWCFGGPWVTPELGASSGMKVKRAGPGGEGLMIDPYSVAAMTNHLCQFERWFGKAGTAERPRAFYHDSYEYYGAKPREKGDSAAQQLACFRAWTDWCRANGYLSRNEAHGAPTNWLDLYALADIPETEMFGHGCRDILISKFASSAAHAKGTTLVSAESCTWIDDHFKERPESVKRFLDLLFLSGVNHVFYHGCCYSPVDVVWPGWCFYAAMEMNPRNPLWREMKALSDYVTRCQSLFQTWTSDNDLAIVWTPSSGELKQMTVHTTDWFDGRPAGRLARRLFAEGYCFDYVSPAMVRDLNLSRYAEVIDPDRGETPSKAVRHPFDAASGLVATRWKKEGATGYFVVNTGVVARIVSADATFASMDPLTGTIDARSAVRLEAGHSRFLIGTGFRIAAAEPEKRAETVSVAGPWTAAGVVGGPALPQSVRLGRLVGWETWAPAFSGTMSYRTRFAAKDVGGRWTLSLGDVREIARVRLNGRDLGVRFMAPYAFEVPAGCLKATDNELEVEVTNLGANRLRWNDQTGVNWKYFYNANMLSFEGIEKKTVVKLDAATWSLQPSGLFGPVMLLR